MARFQAGIKCNCSFSADQFILMIIVAGTAESSEPARFRKAPRTIIIKAPDETWVLSVSV